MDKRTPRDLETREATERKQSWKPPALLPTPIDRPGVAHRWIRTSALGSTDAVNVSKKFRENWVPVKAADYPELQLSADKNSQWPDGIEVGGLLLCASSQESRDQRKEYYDSLAKSQIQAMDNAVLRESDPRMPMLRPERRSDTSFGKKPD